MQPSLYIFKTNINTMDQLRKADHVLSNRTEIQKWNVDIDDCDKVLRVETSQLLIESVIGILKPHAIYCEELK